jgi:hypothetical protein
MWEGGRQGAMVGGKGWKGGWEEEMKAIRDGKKDK